MAFRSDVALTLALLCVLAYVRYAMALTEDQIALMNQLHNSCVEQTGVDEGLINGFRAGNIVEDPKLKCYMKCTYEQIAVIDEDGVIDGEAMIAMVPEEFANDAPPVVRKCMSVKGADACDTAFLFNKCMYNESPSKFMLI